MVSPTLLAPSLPYSQGTSASPTLLTRKSEPPISRARSLVLSGQRYCVRLSHLTLSEGRKHFQTYTSSTPKINEAEEERASGDHYLTCPCGSRVRGHARVVDGIGGRTMWEFAPFAIGAKIDAYACQSCGRVIKFGSLKVVGRIDGHNPDLGAPPLREAGNSCDTIDVAHSLVESRLSESASADLLQPGASFAVVPADASEVGNDILTVLEVSDQSQRVWVSFEGRHVDLRLFIARMERETVEGCIFAVCGFPVGEGIGDRDVVDQSVLCCASIMGSLESARRVMERPSFVTEWSHDEYTLVPVSR
jgi:hypothetical protein